MAIVGPSGCGKTTLLKIIAGLQIETAGRIFWQGKDVSEEGDIPSKELGYVPQFSIAHDHLTVEECIDNAIRLRTCLGGDELVELADRIIAEVGMENLRDKPVRVLSGGQKRRLGLAMELVTHPKLLLCDEVTSGLDPQSEQEIVELMHRLSLREHRIVVNVTHSLSHLELYDSVLVMSAGRVVYHGPPAAMLHYFSVESFEKLYSMLPAREPAAWQESWLKHRPAYYKQLETKLARRPQPATPVMPGEKPTKPVGEAGENAAETQAEEEADSSLELPGALRQFMVLFSRRWSLFFRDRTQLLLQLLLLVIFPILVVIFAHKGIDPMPDAAVDTAILGPEKALMMQADLVQKQTRIGGLISGLVMFQVVLLTLMGSNNSAREVAGERLVYEKERLGGVRPGAYVASKVAFLGVLVLIQSSWMALFVDHFCGFRGDFMDRLKLLVMVNAAMTSICLGISSLMKSADQASLLSIYLVGFQLPLSGAVLKLPDFMEKLIQPFISAYWSWAGQLSGMKMTPDYVGITRAVPTTLVSTPDIGFNWLLLHIAAGIFLSWLGCMSRRWE